MHAGEEVPVVDEHVLIREAIYEITSKRLGATFVVDQEKRLSGILTDGDLRRIFQRDDHPLDLTVRACMTQRPITISKDLLAVDALRLMEDKLITLLPVVDENEHVLGALHIHYLIRAGIG
jgi:arabinose-5-phosphate isomerase